MPNIIRVKKRDNPFVQIDKRAIQNKSISWKAKGLLCYLLSMPDDWQFYINELKKHATDGRDATRSALNELIDAGYVSKERKHNDDGTFSGYEYIVYESPSMAYQSIYGFSENGSAENGFSENGESVTTNNNSTDKDSTNKRKEELSTGAQVTEKISSSRAERLFAAQTLNELLELWVEYRREEIGKPLGSDATKLAHHKMKQWGLEFTRESMVVAFTNEYEGLKPYAGHSF